MKNLLFEMHSLGFEFCISQFYFQILNCLYNNIRKEIIIVFPAVGVFNSLIGKSERKYAKIYFDFIQFFL